MVCIQMHPYVHCQHCIDTCFAKEGGSFFENFGNACQLGTDHKLNARSCKQNWENTSWSRLPVHLFRLSLQIIRSIQLCLSRRQIVKKVRASCAGAQFYDHQNQPYNFFEDAPHGSAIFEHAKTCNLAKQVSLNVDIILSHRFV